MTEEESDFLCKLEVCVEQSINALLDAKDAVIVGVSGGQDSMFLCHIFSALKRRNVCCVTVDHKLRPSSTAESILVKDYIEKHYNFSVKVLTWEHENDVRSNIEHRARQARYELICSYAKSIKCSTIAVAHHLNDLAETMLINISRGSGVDGLACMRPRSKMLEVDVVRPLLSIAKKDIARYVKLRNILYVQDESNSNTKFTRNLVRHSLEKVIGSDLLNHRLSILNKNSIRVSECLNWYTKNFVLNEVKVDEASGVIKFKVESFCNLPEEIALRVLCAISEILSGEHYKPRLERVERLLRFIKQNRSKLKSKRMSIFHSIVEIDSGDIVFVQEISERVQNGKTGNGKEKGRWEFTKDGQTQSFV